MFQYSVTSYRFLVCKALFDITMKSKALQLSTVLGNGINIYSETDIACLQDLPSLIVALKLTAPSLTKDNENSLDSSKRQSNVYYAIIQQALPNHAYDTHM